MMLFRIALLGALIFVVGFTAGAVSIRLSQAAAVCWAEEAR